MFEEHFEDRANALVCYDNVLALDPNHVSTLKHEERLLKETKEWEKLIQVLLTSRAAHRRAARDREVLHPDW